MASPRPAGLPAALLQGREADGQQQGVLPTLQSPPRFHQEAGDLEASAHRPGALKTVSGDVWFGKTGHAFIPHGAVRFGNEAFEVFAF